MSADPQALTVDSLLNAMRLLPRPSRSMFIVPQGYLRGYETHFPIAPFGVRVVESSYLPTFQSVAHRRRQVRQWIRGEVYARRQRLAHVSLPQRREPTGYLVELPNG
jgi:hypothetical protein